jgi:SecD/SecF fusion protein
MSRAFLSALAVVVSALAACGGQAASAPCSQPPGGSTVELVYRVAAGDARATAARLCTRLRTAGSDRFEVNPAGSGRIRIVARDHEKALTTLDAAIEGTSLRIYDWEPNVLGSRGPAAPFAGGAALFEAVKAAYRPGSPPARYYLFGPDRHPLGPSAASCEELLAPYTREPGSASYPRDSDCLPRLRALGGGGPPPGSRVLDTPEGVAVIEDQRAPGEPPQLRRYFAIEDDAELSDSEIRNPRVEADEVTGGAVVAFDFTAQGRRAFRRLTRRVATRAARAASANGPSEASFQHFAIVVDDRVVSLAAIDGVVNPDGIDAPGAQIAGLDSPEAAQRLAHRLAQPPLDAKLELASVRR